MIGYFEFWRSSQLKFKEVARSYLLRFNLYHLLDKINVLLTAALNNNNNIGKNSETGSGNYKEVVTLLPSLVSLVSSTQTRPKDPSITSSRPKLMTQTFHWFKLGTYVFPSVLLPRGVGSRPNPFR